MTPDQRTPGQEISKRLRQTSFFRSPFKVYFNSIYWNPIRLYSKPSIVAEKLQQLGDTMSVRSKLYAAYESVPDALFIVGRDGSIVFANQHAERLFGFEPGELVGLEIEALIPERYRQRHAAVRAEFSVDPASPWDSGGNCSH